MRTKVILKVVDEDNVTQSSFVLDFLGNQTHLDAFVQVNLECSLLYRAIITPEVCTYPMTINDIPVEQGSKYLQFVPSSEDSEQT